MKILILFFSLILSLNLFATGNTTMQPVSTQKVANASLTCPTGKWCRVVVDLHVNSGIASGTCYWQNAFKSFEVIIKSGEVISGTVVGNLLVSSTSASAVSITVNVAGSQVGYVNAWMSCTTSGLVTTTQQYSFYSMEYFN